MDLAETGEWAADEREFCEPNAEGLRPPAAIPGRLRAGVAARAPFAWHHDKLTAHLEHARSNQGEGEGQQVAPDERLGLTTRAIQLRITTAMACCGMRDASAPHSLRHAAVTEAARTESPFKVQVMLDDKDIPTMQKYSHLIDRLEEGAEYAITRY